MIAGKALLGIGALAGGLLLMGRGKASAKDKAPKHVKEKKTPKPGEPGGAPASSQPGAGAKVPPTVLARIAAAVKSDNAAVMRKLANELEKQGYGAQAADLRARAAELEHEKGPAPLSEKEVELILSTVAKGNVETIRQLAKLLRAQGHKREADDLDAAANDLETAASEAAKTSSTTTPAKPTPKVKIVAKTPGVVKDAPQFTPTDAASVDAAIEHAVAKATKAAAEAAAAAGPSESERQLAGQVAFSLMNAKKGSEDKALVARFQTQEGIRNSQGLADGYYGKSTGLVLSEKYDIVPPKPLYWGTKAGGWNSVVLDKSAWKSAMLSHAKTDAPRAEEWARAAAV